MLSEMSVNGNRIESDNIDKNKLSIISEHILSYDEQGTKIEKDTILYEKYSGVFLRDRAAFRLLIASENGHFDVVKYLIEEHSVDIESQSDSKETPLALACWAGKLDIVKYLVKKGANINYTIDDSCRPIKFAFRRFYNKTPIFSACMRGHTEIARYLIENGAHFNITDDYGETPLFIASINGHYNVVELLVSLGAEINVSRHKPLSAACSLDGLDLLRLRAFYGHASDDFEKLYLGACIYNPISMDLYFDGEQGSNYFDQTQLINDRLTNYFKIIKHLIEHGAKYDSSSGIFNRLIEISAIRGNLDIIKYCLDLGVNVNITNRKGKTTLQLLKENNHLNIIKFLQYYRKNLPKPQKLSKDNSVTIRMWLPKYKKQAVPLYKALFSFSDDANVGHISIAIRDGSGETYISHWPNERPANPLASVPGANNPLWQDWKCEQGLPDMQIILYSLDTQKMLEHYKKIGEKIRWFIGGNKVFSKTTGENYSHSCSSFVYEILEKGGIFDYLLTTNDKLRGPVSPSEVANLAKNAQEVEGLFYPETENFFEENMVSFRKALIEESKKVFMAKEAVETFLTKHLDFYFLFAANYQSELLSIVKELHINLRESASKELLEHAQSLDENANEHYINNMILPRIKKLIEQKADLTIRTKEGYNVIHCLIIKQNLPCLKVLIDAFPDAVNAEISYPNSTQKLAGINRGEIPNSYFFLSDNKEAKLSPPITPLDLAIDIGNEDIISFLKSHRGTAVARSTSVSMIKNILNL